MSSFDFDAFEQLWVSSIARALSSFSLAPNDRVYALAFWQLYSEQGSVIYRPSVGIGSEAGWEKIRDGEPRDAGFGSLRWNPADWPHSILDLPDAQALDAAYLGLATHACGGIDPNTMREVDALPAAYEASWSAVYDRGTGTLVHVARELTRRAHARVEAFAKLPVADDFVAVVCDPSLGEEGEELLRACVGEPLLSRLYPNLDCT